MIRYKWIKAGVEVYYYEKLVARGTWHVTKPIGIDLEFVEGHGLDKALMHTIGDSIGKEKICDVRMSVAS